MRGAGGSPPARRRHCFGFTCGGAWLRGPVKACRNFLAGLVELPGLEVWALFWDFVRQTARKQTMPRSVEQPTALARTAQPGLRWSEGGVIDESVRGAGGEPPARRRHLLLRRTASRRGPDKVCRNSFAGLVMLPGLEFCTSCCALRGRRPGNKRCHAQSNSRQSLPGPRRLALGYAGMQARIENV